MRGVKLSIYHNPHYILKDRIRVINKDVNIFSKYCNYISTLESIYCNTCCSAL